MHSIIRVLAHRVIINLLIFVNNGSSSNNNNIKNLYDAVAAAAAIDYTYTRNYRIGISYIYIIYTSWRQDQRPQELEVDGTASLNGLSNISYTTRDAITISYLYLKLI